MNEYLLKLQEDRKVTYLMAGLIAVLACLTVVVAINKYGSNSGAVSASADNVVSGPQKVQEDASEETSADDSEDVAGPQPIANQDDEAEADESAAPTGEAVAFGIETTTTTTTTTAPAPEPDPEPVPDPEPAPAPDPGEGEEGFVDSGNGVLVPPVLLKIRFCESTDNYLARNPNSTAAGGYQFLTGSWEAYGHAERYGVSSADQATPAQQDEAALITWQRDGTKPWNASMSCWINR